jgi:cyanophycinase-like exopeptidase
VRRIPGNGWLAAIGGGEFSFGETLLADRVWLDKTTDGPVGFLPAASGSKDYFDNFSRYLAETFERQCELIPIYRRRDARRTKNLDRIEECAAVYMGGGVADELLDALAESPALEALGHKLGAGGVIVGIAAAAQSMGRAIRSLYGGQALQGLRWLPEGVIEPNFDPGHDRRLRQLMEVEGIRWGLGLAASSAILFGPGEAIEYVGTSFLLDEADGDFKILGA